MDLEMLKLLVGGGPSAVLLGLVLLRLQPAIAELARVITRMDARQEVMLTNHLKHLPGEVADELERRSRENAQ